MPEANAAPDTCPRCGGGFQCGMAGAGPCPCTTVTLSEATLAGLRQRYAGCLCLKCLAELAQEGLSTSTRSAAPPRRR